MRKKLATRRSNRTTIVKNPPSLSAPQTHTRIHIHPNSSSSPSSHSTASMARKTIHARATARQEAGSSKKNTKGQDQVPEEEEEESLPSPQPSPPRCSTPHLSSRVHLTLNRDIMSTALGYHDEGARAYMSGKWDSHVGVSLQVALTRRVTICDTLVLFAILSSASILFAYLMMRHMWDCVRSDKKENLPYGMFLTCIFEYFNIDLSNEPVENRVSTIKGGSIPDSVKGKKGKSSMASMLSDSESDNHPSKSSKLSEFVKDVLNEFSHMSSMMVRTYKEARKQAYENEKAWTKCHERVNLLIKSLEKDMAHSDGDDDHLDSDINPSDA
ncbi:uncharacterized protein DS421_5g154330 [Arachis hypogaea]|nr:uncharacterized protein DS421_5g154330 [Arachis hypogaea]